MRLVLLLAILSTLAAGAPIRDGFEDRTPSDLWDLSRCAPRAVQLQHAVVREGRGAMEIILHPHDQFAQGKHGDPDTERDEICEIPPLFAEEDQGYEYSWSMYLPKDFPIVPTRLVVAQWKQTQQNPDAPEFDDHPVVAVRYIAGSLKITLDRAQEPTRTLYEEKIDLRGRWLDLRFQLRFSPNDTGMVSAWLNKKQVVAYRGPTANPETERSGYPAPSRYYFKMGLYRDVMPGTMTLYLDDYRKRSID